MQVQGFWILAILIAVPVLASLFWRKPVVQIASIALSYYVVGFLSRIMPDQFATLKMESSSSALEQYYKHATGEVWFDISAFLAGIAIFTGLLAFAKALFYPRLACVLFWLLHIGIAALVVLPRLVTSPDAAGKDSQKMIEMLQFGGQADTLVIVCVFLLVVLLIWSLILRKFGRAA